MISVVNNFKLVFPPQKANDKQLLDDHRIVHAWWSLVVSKKRKILTKEEIIYRHTQIVKEMIKRGFKHYYRSSLDDTLPKNLRKKTINV